MKVHQIFITTLLICSTKCVFSIFKFSLETFTSPTPVQNVLWDSVSKNVFVGAVNHLLKLDDNLTLVQDSVTGPVQDNVNCPPLPAPCDQPRKTMDNNPKILLEFDQTILFMCGTANQGMCSIFKKSNIVTARVPIGRVNDSKSYVAGRESVVAFFAAGYNTSLALYTATEFDDRPKKVAHHSLCSKIMQKGSDILSLNYTYKSEDSITAVDFDKSFKSHIKFIHGFSYNGFAYFLSTQLLHHDVFETRLGRVCENKQKFASYSEIPLRCMKGPVNFNLATSAYLGKSGLSDEKLWDEDETDMWSLYVTFESSPSSSQLKKDQGSVLCIFPMPQIESFFWRATRDCIEGRRGAYRLKNILGSETRCEKSFVVGDDHVERALCDPGRNDHILGSETLTGRARVNLTETVTSLAVTLQNDSAVAFLGTNTGSVLKFILEDKEYNPVLYNVSLFGEQNMSDSRVRRSVAFDDQHNNLYMLIDNRVVKFPAKSCSPYADCLSCLNHEDPLGCGWCVDRCASKEECPGDIEKFVCPPLIFSVNPLRAHVNGGTLLTIEGDNFGSNLSGEKAKIIVTANGRPCEIIRWEYKRIQCRAQNQSENSIGHVSVWVQDYSYEHGRLDIKGEATSEDLVSFLNPEFYGISPWFGPASGGTNVTLFGENLDVGTNLSVRFSGFYCKILKNNGSHVTCTSSANAETNSAVQNGTIMTDVVVEIDGNFLEANLSQCSQDVDCQDWFQFRPDPEIYDLWPKATSFSIGSNLTVSGHHLDSVSRPRIIVTVVTDPLKGIKKDMIQDCFSGDLNGTTLYCPTPSLEGLTLTSPPTSKVPLQTHITFLLDGAPDPLRFSYNKNQLSQLLYYPDPVFYRFESNVSKVVTDNLEITIQGENLNLALQKEMIFVSVNGNIHCTITQLTIVDLHCIILNTTELPSSSSWQEFPVLVRVGNREFWVGNILLVDPPPDLLTRVLVPVVLGIILLLALVLLVLKRKGLLTCRKHRKMHNSEFHVTYTANLMDRINAGNEYLESPGGANGPMMTTFCAAAATKAPKISEETIHLLKVENILFERICLILEEEIGQGHFGRVYKGEHRMAEKEHSRQVAVKTLHNCRYQDEESVESFLQEGLMMKDFHHHHVLTLIGVCFEDNGFPMVILPYMENGDLRSYIQNENNEPTIKLLIEFGIQIAEGMQYLSELKFIHRDLAARNCMLDSDLTVKVADFGLSRDVYEREYYSSDNKKSKLPVKWMAPESLEKGTYSIKTDVWSYGVVLWELMTRGVTPYPEVGNWEILQYIKEGRRMLQPSFCPDDLYRLMLRCWNEDPRKRPTFSELTAESKELISKMEIKHRQKTVGLNVTYANLSQSKKNCGDA